MNKLPRNIDLMFNFEHNFVNFVWPAEKVAVATCSLLNNEFS